MSNQDDAIKNELEEFYNNSGVEGNLNFANYLKENFSSLSEAAQDYTAKSLTEMTETYLKEKGREVKHVLNDSATKTALEAVDLDADKSDIVDFLKKTVELAELMDMGDIQQEMQQELDKIHVIISYANTVQEILGKDTTAPVKEFLTKISAATDEQYNDFAWISAAIYETYESNYAPKPKANPLSGQKFKF